MTGAAAPNDPDTIRRILQERAEALARPPEVEERSEMMGVLGLVVGGERYALQLGQVVAIEPLFKLVPLPGVPACWAGLGNLRGTIYPILDLAAYLDVASAATAQERKVVLVSAAGMSVGLLADDVSDVTWIRRGDAAPAPGRARGGHAGVTGVTSDLVALLDLERLLADPALVVDHQGF